MKPLVAGEAFVRPKFGKTRAQSAAVICHMSLQVAALVFTYLAFFDQDSSLLKQGRTRSSCTRANRRWNVAVPARDTSTVLNTTHFYASYSTTARAPCAWERRICCLRFSVYMLARLPGFISALSQHEQASGRDAQRLIPIRGVALLSQAALHAGGHQAQGLGHGGAHLR
jgi:hypothetical protein